MNRRAAPVAGIAFRMAQIKRDSEESGGGWLWGDDTEILWGDDTNILVNEES